MKKKKSSFFIINNLIPFSNTCISLAIYIYTVSSLLCSIYASLFPVSRHNFAYFKLGRRTGSIFCFFLHHICIVAVRYTPFSDIENMYLNTLSNKKIMFLLHNLQIAMPNPENFFTQGKMVKCLGRI